MKQISLLIFCLLCSGYFVFGQKKNPKASPQPLTEDQIIDRYVKNGAWHYWMFSPEWQMCLDSAIAINPKIAYVYQQKAMPYFKQRKYEVGMQWLDKAVEFDAKKYIDYRAFMKCIYSKSYREAIQDFVEAQRLINENGFVMDHSFNFYIGICHLQLNNYERAIEYLQKSISFTVNGNGEKWVPYLENFYLAISYQELQKHEEAIQYFDKTLAVYKEFSDAEYYKAFSLFRSRKQLAQAMELIKDSQQHFLLGYTINEINAKYEKYPYQIDQGLLDAIRQK